MKNFVSIHADVGIKIAVILYIVAETGNICAAKYDCNNLLSAKRSLSIVDTNGKIIEKFNDCTKLVKKYGRLCLSSTVVKRICCNACTVTDGCVDLVTKEIPLQAIDANGNTFETSECSTLAKIDTYMQLCFHEEIRQLCCLSCRRVGCQDIVSIGNALIVKDTNNETLGNFTSCGDLIKIFGQLCISETPGIASMVKERCCSTCKEADLRCVDSLTGVFEYQGTSLKCGPLISMNPCHCIKNYEVVAGTVVPDECCASCRKVAPQILWDCECYNKMTPSQTITPIEGGVTYDDCEQMMSDFPELCPRYGSLKKHICCNVCQSIDYSCLDSKIKPIQQRWVSPTTGQPVNCSEIIAEDKCYCSLFKDECCHSCLPYSENDLKDCCINDPLHKITIRKRVFGNGRRSCNRCTCKKIYDLVGSVSMKLICDKNHENAAVKCCHSCKLANTS